jgi:hypothetical protein
MPRTHFPEMRVRASSSTFVEVISKLAEANQEARRILGLAFNMAASMDKTKKRSPGGLSRRNPRQQQAISPETSRNRTRQEIRWKRKKRIIRFAGSHRRTLRFTSCRRFLETSR